LLSADSELLRPTHPLSHPLRHPISHSTDPRAVSKQPRLLSSDLGPRTPDLGTSEPRNLPRLSAASLPRLRYGANASPEDDRLPRFVYYSTYEALVTPYALRLTLLALPYLVRKRAHPTLLPAPFHYNAYSGAPTSTPFTSSYPRHEKGPKHGQGIIANRLVGAYLLGFFKASISSNGFLLAFSSFITLVLPAAAAAAAAVAAVAVAVVAVATAAAAAAAAVFLVEELRRFEIRHEIFIYDPPICSFNATVHTLPEAGNTRYRNCFLLC
jgi:hypothetical protein